MSIIGIYDADMVNYTHVPFNIDVMKIATYEKKKKNLVTLTDTCDFDKYSKLIYRKDYYDGQFDSNILLNPKVEFGGRAFDKSKYTSLPLEIEQCRPDRYLYKPMEKLFATNKVNQNLFDHMMRAQHVRISLDGKNIWNDWKCQLDPSASIRTCIIHDYDLCNVENGIEVVKEILQTIPGTQTKYLGFKFPLHIYDAATLMKWAQFNPMNKFYTIHYHGMLTDQELVDFYKTQKGTSICSQLIYDVTANTIEENFIKNQLLPLYKQIVFLRSSHQSILLKYDDTIFSDKKWVRILDLYKMYLTQAINMSKEDFERIIPFDSMLSLVSNFEDKETYKFHFKDTEQPLMLIDEARELFRFLQSENYELFKAFYECHTVKLKGGIFEYD